jgi:hypothetical protein
LWTGVPGVVTAEGLEPIKMFILFGVTTFVFYLVLFGMANRQRERSSAHPKAFYEVPADSAANPRAVVGEDAVLTGAPAWTSLDDHQLDRFLKDSSP